MKTLGLFHEKANVLFPGVEAQMFAGEQLMVMRVTLKQDAVATAHSHHHEQMSVVIKGEIEFTLGDEKKILKRGDVISIPGHIVHSAHAITETELVEVFTPVRQDLVERFAL